MLAILHCKPCLAETMVCTAPKQQAQAILAEIHDAERGFDNNEPGSREKLLSLTYALATALELPSETIQRMGWTEVCHEHAPVPFKTI